MKRANLPIGARIVASISVILPAMLRRPLASPVAAAVCSLALLAAACSSGNPARSSSPAKTEASAVTTAVPPIHHVFVIMLENEGYSATFGNPANDPYLARTLVDKGALLTNYYAVGHVSLDNYVAMVSGQPPNANTEADCVGGFAAFPPGAGQETWAGATDVQEGNGCVYPPSVQTVGNQLSSRSLSWKAYMQDMGNNPIRDGAPSGVCGHPQVNAPEPTVVAVSGDGYVTRHDPFVYFQSVIDNPAYCDAHVVPLGTPSGAMPSSDTGGATGLAVDLRSIATTPNFAFISPNVCYDGHDYPCINQPSPGPSALANVDSFLETWVPLITGSPAFKKDGLLEITFDEADTTDSTSCCGEQPGPGQAGTASGASGGGRVGAVLISPFIKPGTVVSKAFNHYSTLASIEDIFGLPHLANAQTVTSTFAQGVFSAYR